jgi:multiple sugar transport system substrate-binding protein
MRLTYMNGGMNDFDILYFPKWKAQTHEFGGTGFPIINGTKNPEEAWLLTKFLVRKESITEFVNAVAQTPARRSVALTGWVKPGTPPEHFTIFWEMLNKPSKAVPAPPEYNETESIFLRYLTLVTANEQTAQQAMTNCSKELNALYAKRPKT